MAMTAGFVSASSINPPSAFYQYQGITFQKVNIGPQGSVNAGYIQFPTLPAPNPTRASPFYQW